MVQLKLNLVILTLNNGSARAVPSEIDTENYASAEEVKEMPQKFSLSH